MELKASLGCGCGCGSRLEGGCILLWLCLYKISIFGNGKLEGASWFF